VRNSGIDGLIRELQKKNASTSPEKKQR
jgi:hypothetical protein